MVKMGSLRIIICRTFSTRDPRKKDVTEPGRICLFAMRGVVHDILRCRLADSDVPVLI